MHTFPRTVTGHAVRTVHTASAARSVVENLRTHSTTQVPFSVELNPPRDADGEARLWRTVRQFE